MFIEELEGQPRTYKPTPAYLQSLCGAAITMNRAWDKVGFGHTYRPEEPDLTKPRANDNATKKGKPEAPAASLPKRRPRVIIDDDGQ